MPELNPGGYYSGYLTMATGMGQNLDRAARLNQFLQDEPIKRQEAQEDIAAKQFQNQNAPTMMQAQMQGSPWQQQQFQQQMNQQAIQNQMAQQNAQRQMALEEQVVARNAEAQRHNIASEDLSRQKEALAQSTQDPFNLSGMNASPKTQQPPQQPGAPTQPAPPPLGVQIAQSAQTPSVSASMADPNITGDDFLKTLPIPAQAMVKAMVEGRQAPPTGMAMKAPFWNTMIQLANKYDPSFDQTIWGARAQTRKSFSPGGKDMVNLNSLNTVVGHLGTLLTAGDALKNNDIQGINTFVNGIQSYLGDPRITNFETAKNAVGNDLMRVFQGVGAGSEKEIAAWKASFDSSNSPAKLHGAINTAADLIDSRVQTMNHAYEQGMGKQADVLQMIYPHSREALNAIQGHTAQTGANAGDTPTPSASMWLDRAIKANPKLNREDIVAQGKKLGKIPETYQ